MTNFIKKISPHNLSQVVFWLLFLLALALAGYGAYLNQLKTLRENLAFEGTKLLAPPVKAAAYLVGDLDSGQILLAKNEKVHFYPASLSKLMTAAVVLDNFSLTDLISVSDYAVSAEGTEGNLEAGEIFTVLDLLKVMLINSSNDAAIAFEEAFMKQGKNLVDLMNEKAQQLGMYNSAFFGSTGLDRKGNFTTALDLFLLARHLYFGYPVLQEITTLPQATVFSQNKSMVHELANTNLLLTSYPNLVLGKTGTTPFAKECLLTVFEIPQENDTMKVTIIVLNSEDRFGDTVKLYDWVQNNY